MNAILDRRIRRWILSACAFLAVSALPDAAPWPATAGAAEAPRMSPSELKSRTGDPNLAIVDVRVGAAFAEAKIPGAAIEDYRKVAEWASKYPKDRTIVLYCS